MNILGLPLTSWLMIIFILFTSLVTIILFAGVFLSGREKKTKIKKDKKESTSVFSSTAKQKKKIIAEPIKNITKEEQYTNVFSGGGVPLQEKTSTVGGGFFSPPTTVPKNVLESENVSPAQKHSPPASNYGTSPENVTLPLKNFVETQPVVAPSPQMGLPDFSEEDAFLEQQAQRRREQTASVRPSPEPSTTPSTAPVPEVTSPGSFQPLPLKPFNVQPSGEADKEKDTPIVPPPPVTFKVTPPPSL